MLALGGRRLRDRAVGLDRTCRRRRGLEPVDMAAAQRRRLVPLSRRPTHPATAATLCLSRELVPAQQLNLPHPQQFDSRPATRLDEAADANPSIFKRLNASPGSLEGRHHAPRNSRSKAPCPATPKIQVSRCPRLPGNTLPSTTVKRPIPAKI